MIPGATQLTLIFLCANSTANARLKPFEIEKDKLF